MMSLMVDLIILVICISDSASGVKKREEQKVNLQGEIKECEKFLCFTFHTRVLFTKVVYTRELQQTQPRIH